MKKMVILASFTLVASLFVLALTLGDFLALHDIRNEYVSEEILNTLSVDLSHELPDWTATAGEWTLVQFSYVARAAFLVLNIITLSALIVTIRRPYQETEQPA
jgi:hypothetical protein